MHHHISQPFQYSFVSLASLSNGTLEDMERMNRYAYADFAAQTRPWPADKFAQKLASYGHDDASLASTLLASAGVKSSSLLLRPDAVCYEVPSKGYVQKIVLRSPSDMEIVSSPLRSHEI